jgi:lipoyl synthase
MDERTSPDHVQTSLAAALTLGFQNGSFHRNAKLKGLNLLLRYEEGCSAKCHFCGLSRARTESPGGKTFIRVAWPVYSLDEIIGRAKGIDQIHRVCLSMITHPRAVEDTLSVVRRLRQETPFFISVLLSPTLIHDKGPLEAMRKAGTERVGIAVDAATPEIFDGLRGRGAGGPHRWDHYWEIVRMAGEVFGKGYAGIHLIVGLGETERDMVEAIRKGQSLGAPTHLFSFFPEKGSPMEGHPLPPVARYRRIQLARWIVNELSGEMTGEMPGADRKMRFDDSGRLIDFGMDVSPLIGLGEPFMTSGCPGRDGKVACNRPYGNERPSGPIRNFPFPPEPEDIEEIRRQIEERD